MKRTSYILVTGEKSLFKSIMQIFCSFLLNMTSNDCSSFVYDLPMISRARSYDPRFKPCTKKMTWSLRTLRIRGTVSQWSLRTLGISNTVMTWSLYHGNNCAYTGHFWSIQDFVLVHANNPVSQLYWERVQCNS